MGNENRELIVLCASLHFLLPYCTTSDAFDNHHLPSARDRSRVPAAQAPGSRAHARVPVRHGARSSIRRRPTTACTAAVLLDVDPVAWCAAAAASGGLPTTVRQRPALRRVVAPERRSSSRGGSIRALGGRCEAEPELAVTALPARSPPRRAALPRRRGVPATRCSSRLATRSMPPRHPLDERMPALGDSRLFTVDAAGDTPAERTAHASLRPRPRARRPEALLGRRRRGREAAASRRRLARPPSGARR